MQHKPAMTRTPINEMLAQRWSPRAFDGTRALTSQQILALCEAARWAPSSSNEQPWRFILCDRYADPSAWLQACAVLKPANQVWATQAAMLVLVCALPLSAANNALNRWCDYDAGAAAFSLCLQASTMGLAAHQMGGFDAGAAHTSFAIPDDVHCLAMIAVGYPGEAAALPEGLRERELAPRSRQPLESRFFAGGWGMPFK
ncbi:MAG: nitroreductase family protein [Gammaproteobacteria bacterium]|nr:nitroreductase family protein [Gammaproteobacteria bacterium]